MSKIDLNTTALKSRQWIINALLELMNEKEFDRISIKELIARADLSRQTFYRHFKSKEDVLKEYISNLYNLFLEELSNLEEKTLFNISVTYFTYWERNKDFLTLITNSKCNYDIINFYYPCMINCLDAIKKDIDICTCTEFEINYIKDFILGGLVNVKINWFKNNFKETPEELAQIIINLFN